MSDFKYRITRNNEMFKPFTADDTPVCGKIFGHAKHTTLHVVPRKHFFTMF